MPGLSPAYAAADRPVVTRTCGVASVDDGSPITPETIFQAGSVTKVVTAFASLRLAAETGSTLASPTRSRTRSRTPMSTRC